MKNAILFSKIDREDGWVCGGLAFTVKNTATYEDAYDEIKDKLESPDLIASIVEDRCLLCDLFHEDETFKFSRTYWNYGLFFEFINSDGDIKEYRFSADFIYLIE